MTNAELHSLARSPADLNADQLLLIFQEIGRRGDVMIFKNDGERTEGRFTIMILIIGQEGLCRRDGDSLSDCVKACLAQYLVRKTILETD